MSQGSPTAPISIRAAKDVVSRIDALAAAVDPFAQLHRESGAAAVSGDERLAARTDQEGHHSSPQAPSASGRRGIRRYRPARRPSGRPDYPRT
jgi:hypothetical protein